MVGVTVQEISLLLNRLMLVAMKYHLTLVMVVIPLLLKNIYSRRIIKINKGN